MGREDWNFLILFFETRVSYVAQAGLELTVFLLLPSKYWGYRHMSVICLEHVFNLYSLLWGREIIVSLKRKRNSYKRGEEEVRKRSFAF
jgi:general stress protein CsbA